MIRIEHNVETGIIAELQLTKQEIDFALFETQQNEEIVLAKQTASNAKATEKAALLAKLGISNDEAKLLLS